MLRHVLQVRISKCIDYGLWTIDYGLWTIDYGLWYGMFRSILQMLEQLQTIHVIVDSAFQMTRKQRFNFLFQKRQLTYQKENMTQTFGISVTKLIHINKCCILNCFNAWNSNEIAEVNLSFI